MPVITATARNVGLVFPTGPVFRPGFKHWYSSAADVSFEACRVIRKQVQDSQIVRVTRVIIIRGLPTAIVSSAQSDWRFPDTRYLTVAEFSVLATPRLHELTDGTRE